MKTCTKKELSETQEFNTCNTEGYTEDELEGFNQEWQEIIEKENIELYSEEYYFKLKNLQDNTSRRR